MMNVKDIERRENNVVAIEVETDAAEFDEAVQRSYLKNRAQLTVPGFRKGKAPRKVVEGMYGADIFYEDAMEELFAKGCREIIHKENFFASSVPQPEVVSAGKEGFTFKIVFTVAPEAKLKAYKGIEAVKPSDVVTEDDYADSMKVLIDRAMHAQAVDRPAQNGDTVNIDFEGFVDGVAFQGGKGENYDLTLGSGQFIPGFEEQLVGLSAGDEKTITVTFPENYSEELGGKEADFKIKVYEVKEKVPVTLDDDFAKDVSEFNTLDELQADIREKLSARKTESANNIFRNNLLKKIAEDMDVEVPEAMIQSGIERALEQMSTSCGFPMPVRDVGVMASLMGLDAETLHNRLEQESLFQINSELILEAVSKAENITATDEEVEKEYEEILKQYQVEADKVREYFDEPTVRRNIRLKKAADLIVENGVALPEPEKTEEEEAPAEEAPAEEAPAAETTEETAE